MDVRILRITLFTAQTFQTVVDTADGLLLYLETFFDMDKVVTIIGNIIPSSDGPFILSRKEAGGLGEIPSFQGQNPNIGSGDLCGVLFHGSIPPNEKRTTDLQDLKRKCKSIVRSRFGWYRGRLPCGHTPHLSGQCHPLFVLFFCQATLATEAGFGPVYPCGLFACVTFRTELLAGGIYLCLCGYIGHKKSHLRAYLIPGGEVALSAEINGKLYKLVLIILQMP